MVSFCWKLKQKIVLFHAEPLPKVISLGRYQPQSLCIPWQLFPVSPWSPDSSHTSTIFPPIMIFTYFFRNPLLYNTTPCFEDLIFFSTNSSLWKPNLPSSTSLNSLSRSTTGDQIGDVLSCLSINWKVQDMQLLFGLGIIKIDNKSTWRLTSCRLLLEMFTHTNIHNYLLPASIYNLSFFFFFPLMVTLRISIRDEWLSNFKNVNLVSFIGSHIQHLCLYKLWEIGEHSLILYVIEFVQDSPTGGKK